jgi:thymidylate synthase
MLVIQARNVNDAYAEGLWRMKMLGREADSRNGKVMRIPTPVTTVYVCPTERMLMDPTRDANPFFHIFEGIWMLAGRNDLDFIGQFNSNIHQYAEEGILQGAYGYRWRYAFGPDQLVWVIKHLKANPSSRRAVMTMYSPSRDQYQEGRAVPKDIPCNTTVYFSVAEDALIMTVCCRSNDLVWGCYGANAVHMSMMQEFVARALDLKVGRYYQMSNDFHLYEKHFHLMEQLPPSDNPYLDGFSDHQPITDSDHWEGDLRQFQEWCSEPDGIYDVPYIVGVLQPMYRAWEEYKKRNKSRAIHNAATCLDDAVATACAQWLGRRQWPEQPDNT